MILILGGIAFAGSMLLLVLGLVALGDQYFNI